mmetsp:Transcript_99393/g.207053  ORF Transcript_99393/g.207053 Transcript_99393/m.207053 type:complete len:164 (-) Transcript_99393:109-600(-)
MFRSPVTVTLLVALSCCNMVNGLGTWPWSSSRSHSNEEGAGEESLSRYLGASDSPGRNWASEEEEKLSKFLAHSNPKRDLPHESEDSNRATAIGFDDREDGSRSLPAAATGTGTASAPATVEVTAAHHEESSANGQLQASSGVIDIPLSSELQTARGQAAAHH